MTRDRKEEMARYVEQNKPKLRFQEARLRDKVRSEMIEAYGGRCKHCGENDAIVMTLDHTFNDPEKEYEECGTSARGGKWLYRKLKREGWPQERFQLLCFNCNMKKEHKRRRDKMVEDHGTPPEIVVLTGGEARAKSGPSKNNKAGFKGIMWVEKRQRWLAGTTANGQYRFFGRYKRIEDAIEAYRIGMTEIWGDKYVPVSDQEIEERLGIKLTPSPETLNATSIEELGF